MRVVSSHRMLLVLATLVATGCAPGGGGETAPSQVDMEGLRADVLAAEDAMNLAVDATDCETGMASIGDADPLFVSNAAVVRTRPELSQLCVEMVAPRTGAVFTVDSRSANVLSEDAAVVVREGNYEISFKDGTSQELYMVMTTVWARGEDGWKMVHLHESFRPLTEN